MTILKKILGISIMAISMMISITDSTYGAEIKGNEVVLEGELDEFKNTDNGENYIDIMEGDSVLGNITTEGVETVLDVSYLKDGEPDSMIRISDMRMHTNEDKSITVKWSDAQGIFHDNANVKPEDNTVTLQKQEIIEGDTTKLEVLDGVISEHGYKWIYFDDLSEKKSYVINFRRVIFDIERYDVCVDESNKSGVYVLDGTKKYNEGLYMCFTTDDEGKLKQIAGMYNVVYSEKVVDNVDTMTVVARGNYAIKIGWNAARNANGYIVYQKVNGVWVRKGITTARTYIYTGLKTGTSYSFAVRPFYKYPNVNLSIYSPKYTSFIACTKPLNPSKVLVSKRGYTALKMSWTKSVGATGYVIYKKVGNKWVRVKVINKANVNSYTYGGLKKNTVHTFAIRPYKVCGGKVAYADGYTVATGRTLK